MSTNETDYDLRERAAESPYGVRQDGEFEIPELQDILDRMEGHLEEYLPHYSPAAGSPEQQLVEVFAMELEAMWESQRELFYSGYFEDAFGGHLDRLLALAGVGRLVRMSATGEVTFSAPSIVTDSPVNIPAGTRVAAPATENSPRIPFKTTEAATIPVGESFVDQVSIRGLAPYETETPREYLGEKTNLSEGTITHISDPIAGVSEVTNPVPTGTDGVRSDGTQFAFQVGRDRETDSELKERYRNQLGFGGKASLRNIRAAVAAMDVVQNAAVEENVTMNDNRSVGGLPPKSVRTTVLAPSGYEDDIAQTLKDTASAGIELYGDTTGQAVVYDDSYTCGFDMAGQVDIYVRASLSVTEEFPSDGETRIIDEIVRYIGGRTTTGESRSGTPIGDDVSHWQVASACDVEGVWDAEVSIGTNFTDAGTGNIEVDPQQVARTSPANIDIETTEVNVP